MEACLIWSEEFYFDATKVEANTSLDSVRLRFTVEAHLEKPFAEGEAQAAGVPEPDSLSAGLPEVDLREIAETNASLHHWIAQGGRQNQGSIHGHHWRIRSDNSSMSWRCSGKRHFSRGATGVVASPVQCHLSPP
jgi:hypothetical protein